VASEQVLDIPVRRHVLTSERPFQAVLDGIYGGISQPDIGALFAKLAASASYEEFSALVRHAQGSAGLMRFLHLDDDQVTILVQELPGGGTQVAYDTVASAIAPYGDAAASQVAQRLDTEVLSLLRQSTGIPATAARRSRGTP
jgi:hypothetical protein